MQFLSLVFYLFLIVLGITFACLNAEPVVVRYYIGTQQIPLSMLVVVLLGVGFIIGLSIGIIEIVRLKFKNKKLGEKLRLLEQEISQLHLYSANSR